MTDDILDEADQETRWLIRFKGNRKLFQAPRPKVPGQQGRPAQHGTKLQLNRAETLRTPARQYRVAQAHGGWVESSVWRDVHVPSRPQLALCAVRVARLSRQRTTALQTGALAGLDGRAMTWTGRSSGASICNGFVWNVCISSPRIPSPGRAGASAIRGARERWTWLVMLAYWHLLLAAPVAHDLARPWEKPLPPGQLPTPGRVQRDYLRIFGLVGSPTNAPKVRGKAPGRAKGYCPAPRPRFQTVYKHPKPAAAA